MRNYQFKERKKSPNWQISFDEFNIKSKKKKGLFNGNTTFKEHLNELIVND